MSRFYKQKPLIHRIREHLRTLMNKRLFHLVLWWRRGDYSRLSLIYQGFIDLLYYKWARNGQGYFLPFFIIMHFSGQSFEGAHHRENRIVLY